MFSPVARAATHQQQVIQLLKQRSKLHRALVYDKSRMATLEQHLLAHVYALCDEEFLQLKPQVSYLVESLKVLSNQSSTGEVIAKYFSDVQEAEHRQAIILVCSLLSNKPSVEMQTHLLDLLLYQQFDLADLVQHFKLNWQVEDLTAARKALLNGSIEPTTSLVSLLFSVSEISDEELSAGYQHNNTDIAVACFVRGLNCTNHRKSANTALFNRFSQTDDTKQKARLLEIAGLSGDPQWLEPCKAFCLEHLEFAFDVLCHFQHVIALPLIIELMSVAHTAEAAYQVWLTLTEYELLMTPQLTDIDNKQQIAGKQRFPNIKQAELYRQHTLSQIKQASHAETGNVVTKSAETNNAKTKRGERLLKGVLFNSDSAAIKLRTYQGLAVQRSLIFAGAINPVLESYQQTLSENAFSQLMTTANVTAGATHAA
ncbi:hypothetical protein DXX93_08690 [Thalassotalea euphylliae]|uniref:Uncharacterized protein n=1 Tax=Thalassotalea euphylliae TaxID=1655234 RepID=A0A3E0TQ71_9GAMM|nr:hypothetical protein [Thalassotalea euphylliae]REL26648.1 hypothetical protein DXX93_08690 [Thalassotalea euphylliae]